MASRSFAMLTGFINVESILSIFGFINVESIFIILVQCHLTILQLICKIRVFLRLSLDRRKKGCSGGKVLGNLGLNYFFTEESSLSKKYSQREVSDNTSVVLPSHIYQCLFFWYMVEI